MDFLGFAGSKDVVLLDGAVGTELEKRGLPAGGQANLVCPEAVRQIHREFAECGCDALTTNTLTMNRAYIDTHKVGVDVGEVNRAGVELAGSAAAAGVYILGDLSSTGQLLEPYGPCTEQQCYDALAEQARVLADAGVDALIVETMFDLREALCALSACKNAGALPVIISMAFKTADRGGRTFMGDLAADCARLLTDAGADAVGTNCGGLPRGDTARIVAAMRSATPLPIAAQPNAGAPRLADGTTVFDIDPEGFAAEIRRCIDAGATLVGGCCGVSPAHIGAVAEHLRGPSV